MPWLGLLCGREHIGLELGLYAIDHDGLERMAPPFTNAAGYEMITRRQVITAQNEFCPEMRFVQLCKPYLPLVLNLSVFHPEPKSLIP